MNEEEKKAIEDFKECYEKDISRYEDFNTYTQYIVKRNELILNLIEKQSKEIEELKEDLKKKPTFLIKDIYLPKIKEISLQDAEGLIEQGREEVRDKIKAKIEEYKKDGKIINQTMPYCGEYKNHFEIKALQSLLEKE